MKCVALGAPTYDTFRATVVVVDAVLVFDEMDRAVLLAEAVAVETMDVLVALTVGAEPVDAGAATVTFTKIGRGVATEEADVDEKTSELSGDMADESEVASEDAACLEETTAKLAILAEYSEAPSQLEGRETIGTQEVKISTVGNGAVVRGSNWWGVRLRRSSSIQRVS